MSDAGEDALTVTSSQREENVPPRWLPQHCVILKTWAEIAASYQYLHLRAYISLAKSNKRFSIPIIVLSTLCGSASLSTSSLPEDWQAMAPSVIGALSICTGVLGTIQEFLKISERESGHRVASLQYGSLARGIRAELSMPVADRSQHGKDYIIHTKEQLDRLAMDSPQVPMPIITSFSKKFKKDKTFARPDLNSISPCLVFDDQEAEAQLQNAVDRSAIDSAARAAAETAAQSAARLAVQAQAQISERERVAASSVGAGLDQLIGNLANVRERAVRSSEEIEDELRRDERTEIPHASDDEDDFTTSVHRDATAAVAAARPAARLAPADRRPADDTTDVTAAATAATDDTEVTAAVDAVDADADADAYAAAAAAPYARGSPGLMSLRRRAEQISIEIQDESDRANTPPPQPPAAQPEQPAEEEQADPQPEQQAEQAQPAEPPQPEQAQPEQPAQPEQAAAEQAQAEQQAEAQAEAQPGAANPGAAEPNPNNTESQ